MSAKQDIRNSLEALCLPGPAIDSVMIHVSLFEVEVAKRVEKDKTRSLYHTIHDDYIAAVNAVHAKAIRDRL